MKKPTQEEVESAIGNILEPIDEYDKEYLRKRDCSKPKCKKKPRFIVFAFENDEYPLVFCKKHHETHYKNIMIQYNQMTEEELMQHANDMFKLNSGDSNG